MAPKAIAPAVNKIRRLSGPKDSTLPDTVTIQYTHSMRKPHCRRSRQIRFNRDSREPNTLRAVDRTNVTRVVIFVDARVRTRQKIEKTNARGGPPVEDDQFELWGGRDAWSAMSPELDAFHRMGWALIVTAVPRTHDGSKCN
jgi:hypothetical protein